MTADTATPLGQTTLVESLTARIKLAGFNPGLEATGCYQVVTVL